MYSVRFSSRRPRGRSRPPRKKARRKRTSSRSRKLPSQRRKNPPGWLQNLAGKFGFGTSRKPTSRRGSPGGSKPPPGWTEVWHGTPSKANAASIRRHGFLVSTGNSLGDGVYFTEDFSQAKGYAGSSGVCIRCWLKKVRCCIWDSAMDRKFRSWCAHRGVNPDNSARTAFLLRSGWRRLRAGKIWVVLAPQFANPGAWKKRFPGVKIVGFHDPRTKKTVRV